METLQVVNPTDNGPYAMRTILGWTDLSEVEVNWWRNTLTRIGANGISVDKLEELCQLQLKEDFPDAGQNIDIEIPKDGHQFISIVSLSALLNCYYNVYLWGDELTEKLLKVTKFDREYAAFMDDLLR